MHGSTLVFLKMQSEAKQSIAQQSNAKQFKAIQSTAQAQHKQSKSKAKAMFRELQRAPMGDIKKLTSLDTEREARESLVLLRTQRKAKQSTT